MNHMPETPQELRLMEQINALVEYLLSKGTSIVEGSSIPAQLLYLHRLAASLPPNSLVAEVGFNAGFSALAFLTANPEIRVYSFDNMHWPCASRAKAWIDLRYANHTLVEGDSRTTLPNFPFPSPVAIAFIDGDHSEEAALSDLRALAPRSTVVVMDDTNWEGPARAWERGVTTGLVTPITTYKSDNRMWTEGRAVHPTTKEQRFMALTAFA